MRKILGNPWARWAISLLILGVILFFLRDQLEFLATGISELRQANPLGVLLAVIAVTASMYAMAEVMRIMLRAGGLDPSRGSTSALTFASNSWSATFPGGPALSAILTFHVQRSWGASVVVCSWFFVLSSALSTMWLVAIGATAVFFLGANISLWSLIASLLAMMSLSALVYWAASNPERVVAVVENLMPRVNRLLRRDAEAGVDKLVSHIRQLNSVRLTSAHFTSTAVWSLLNRLLDAAGLWVCVWAVTDHLPLLASQKDNTNLGGIFLAYATAKIVGSLQATPGGIGPVEATYIAALVTSGMTAVDAAGAVIIYRLISFILMALIGWVVYFLYYTPKGISAREIQSDSMEALEAPSAAPERFEK
ncbi:lysylphosphatidylglycerol synthase transmembrane domain-containing protein [Corynebacterium pacaense]|uniref:lysylphosphatidylglycerol synthase transmembrane domain-containing protein n=1 Tax=Corynebacterium pacaense TaxID=1816684 RepID=UPI0009B93A40|nr:YbhN family protein [Corynebacterium pacaense]